MKPSMSAAQTPNSNSAKQQQGRGNSATPSSSGMGAGKENVTPGGIADLLLSSSKGGSSATQHTMSTKETASRYGVECSPATKGSDNVVFENWKPGSEYVQKLILRNVCCDVVKVKYTLPQTRFFSLAFPEVFTLVPGMFREIDVIFRPTEYQPYDDSILFKMLAGPGTGGFLVPVTATINKLIISAPSGVDLGFCPTHQVSTTTFTIRNSGEIPAPYRFECPPPFVLEPQRGQLAVRETQEVTVTIFPTEASVVVSQVLCHVGEGVVAAIPEPLLKIKVGAIGKFGYVCLSEDELSFGEVLPGTPHSSPLLWKEIVLKNPSPVPTDFTVARQDRDRDELFTVEPRSGQVPAHGELAVTVRYSPLSAGTYSCDRYTFQTPGHLKQTLLCRGLAVPPKITLFKDRPEGATRHTVYKPGSPAWSLNFNSLQLGQRSTRVFFLHNDGLVPTSYDVLCDDRSMFSFSPKRGVIPAQLQVAITVSFAPRLPINYYRRFFVLFGDCPPTFVDVFGSGFVAANGEVKEQRPAPLRYAHVQASRNRHAAGMGALEPEALDGMYRALEAAGDVAEGRAVVMSDKVKLFALVSEDGTPPLKCSLLREPLTRSGESTRSQLGAAHEMHIRHTDSGRPVALLQDSVDFGYAERGAAKAQKRTVTVRNNTDSKVTAVWHCGDSSSSRGEPAPFSIEPPQADVPARGTCTFQVCFSPSQEDRNYVQEIEAQVFLKNQRTFRLVSDATLTAPWSLQLRAGGHSFASGQLPAKARFGGHCVREGKLSFPCTFVSDSSFMNVLVRNSSDLPGSFKLLFGRDDSGSGSSVFSVHPNEGEIGASDFVIVSVRFSPKTVSTYKDALRCVVNGSCCDTLLLEGQAQMPYLYCPDFGNPMLAAPRQGEFELADVLRSLPQGSQGTFYLKPTCVGLSSSRALVFRNGSRLPLRYCASLQGAGSDAATVSEPRGIVRGNEDVVLTVRFAPRTVAPYRIRLRISTYPVAGEPEEPVVDALQIGGVRKAEPLQSINVTLVAKGEVGALLFSPPRLAVAPRLVGQAETREIWLENVSDCNLQYDLQYVQEHSAVAGEQGGDASIKRRRSRPLRSQRHSKERQEEEEEHLFCEAPQGVISARSRKRVLFTFLPQIDGLYEFFIVAQLTTIDAGGQPYELSNEEAMLLRLSASERLDTLTGELNVSALREAVAALPCAASITASASFPTVSFDDVRSGPSSRDDVEQLWRQMSLTALNDKLQQPLSAAEAHLFHGSSPDLARFDRFSFQFTPAAQHSRCQSLYLRMTNRGLLPAHFSIHWPNDKTLNLEQWCDEDEPGEEIIRIVDIIEALKLFSLEPRSGLLAPGESVTFALSYSYASIKYNGNHKIPLLLRLDNGRALFIDLLGQTLEQSDSNRAAHTLKRLAARTGSSVPTLVRNIIAQSRTGIERYLLCAPTGTTGHLQLPAVPIGISPSAPLRQQIEVRNVSATAISYTVDNTKIDALNDECGFQVASVPLASGIVPARSVGRIDVYLCPFEARPHSFEFKMSYRAIDSTHAGEAGCSPASPSRGGLTDNARNQEYTRGAAAEPHIRIIDPSLKLLKFGVGFDAFDSRAPPPEPLPLPLCQTISIEGQLASISADVLSFGSLLQGSSAHRLTVVRNLTKHRLAVQLQPANSPLFDQGLVHVSPSSFTLERDEHAVVDFSIDARCGNCYFYDTFLLVAREALAPHASRRLALTASKIATKLHSAVARPPRLSVVVTPTAMSDGKLVGAAAASAPDGALRPPGAVGGGRRGSLPSTIGADGKLLQPATMREDDRQQTVSWTEPAGDLASRATGSSGGFRAGSTDGSVLRSQSAPGGSRAEMRSRASATINSGPAALGTTITAAASTADSVPQGYENYELKDGVLLGPETFLNIRLRGSIFDRRTLEMVAPEALHDCFAPSAEAVFVPPHGSSLAELSAAALCGGGAVTREALPVPLSRQRELRSTAEAVAASLFRDLLAEQPLRCLVDETVQETKTAGRLAIDALGRVSGRPAHGIYWPELKSTPAVPRPQETPADAVRLLLGSGPFLGGVAQEVLRNTFFNILQEVSFGEYTLGCLGEGEEPLLLVTAKK